MSNNYALTDCRFCSVVSKTNGEDPIASVGTFDHWLLVEMAQPWSPQIGQHSTLQPVIEMLTALRQEHGIKVRPLLIAPDREYSYPHATRVLYYQRPARLFAKFQKQEFLLPEEQIYPLAKALLKQPEELQYFEQYQQQTSHIRELMVCTHANHDAACGRFGYPIYKKLRSQYAANSQGQLRVWRVSHFGGHRFAPTLVDFPEGRYWGHLEPEMLDLLVQRNGSVLGLRQFYRGWTGLTKWEQIAEREIWMQQGWDWIDYYKAGQVLGIDEQEETWAEVRIDFTTPDGSKSGGYEARVEVSGEVTTAPKSGDEMSLQAAKQYRVSHLVQVE